MFHKLLASLPIVACLLIIAGCGISSGSWSKPGATEQEFHAARFACLERATSHYLRPPPPDQVIVQVEDDEDLGFNTGSSVKVSTGSSFQKGLREQREAKALERSTKLQRYVDDELFEACMAAL